MNAKYNNDSANKLIIILILIQILMYFYLFRSNTFWMYIYISRKLNIAKLILALLLAHS